MDIFKAPKVHPPTAILFLANFAFDFNTLKRNQFYCSRCGCLSNRIRFDLLLNAPCSLGFWLLWMWMRIWIWILAWSWIPILHLKIPIERRDEMRCGREKLVYKLNAGVECYENEMKMLLRSIPYAHDLRMIMIHIYISIYLYRRLMC